MGIGSSLYKTIKAIFAVETAQLRTNTVCKVVAYDETTNLVSLQPCIMGINTDNTETPVEQLPQVNDIPVFQFGSGKLMCTVAPAVDSYGLYVVSDRKLDNWITLGGVQPPGSTKRFDISNGFFLPGLYPTVEDGDNGLIATGIETDRIELRTRTGITSISVIDDETVNINNELCAVSMAADGGLRLENDAGYAEMTASTGQWIVNGNFTVDP